MKNHTREYAFLGTGWKFPITVDGITGRMEESSYEENIQQSIYLIIMTKPGERVMRPDFGCEIHNFMFENIDYTTLSRMKQAVEEALIRWEPRITDTEVTVVDAVREQNAVELQIAYRVRTTNNPYNLVFPFYLEET